ncbi:antibiotic biosynthesis monooxygenase [Pseudomonas sp. SWRI154]|uniref:antibiotic biosynthesis monooxygenase n=1 Tax=Pseudomonas sp. SWRI154 TaxID=2745501 RepID=UPI0016457B20|nr:antibiotic biosynthesis monooxygenase [Pseudomonas sp. SWRI154]MBC3363670.1 antibiotic biosynthesis monooxygenase [Pseudomonas sp. SWRI154]
MQSPSNNRSFTQLIEFDIEPQSLQALVIALTKQTERLARDHLGFLSASIQASDDGRRVLNYLQWQTREAGEAAFRSFENGEENFWQLIQAHRAKAVTFGSFQVLHDIERSLDNALQCRWLRQAQREIREGDTHYQNR